MYYGLSLIKGDVADHRNHFDMPFDGDLLVRLALGIKPCQCRSTQRSDSGEMRTRYVILLRKIQQSGKGLVSLTEDDCILSRLFSWAQQLNLHARSSAPWNGFGRRDIFACLLL